MRKFYLQLSAIILLLVIVSIQKVNAQTPSNDNCSGAISLTLNSSCAYTTYTNVSATASTTPSTPPAPGCASYSSGDVWFSFVVPSNGQVTVDMQAGTMTDSGMAWYTGTCSGLTLLECDDDDSANGLMSYISRTGLTPGNTIYVRVWGYSNSYGTFGICATTPAPVNDNCSGAIPLTFNTTCTYTSYSNSGATTSTSPSTPPAPGCANYTSGDVWFSATVPTNGVVTVDLQSGTMTNSGMAFYTGTCSGLTLLECDDDDSTNGSMSYISRTGLTSGSTIYIRVWGYGNTYGTFGICATSALPAGCTQGNSQGVSSLGCPSVDSGGLGLSGADPAPFSCSAPSTCVDLEANYLTLGETTSYTVESIPYNPPYQFDCLKNPVSVNTDDVWSPLINLPFDFCFYGNTYNQCLIGSNGVITFDTANNPASGYCGYSFAANLPASGDASLIENAIFGVFHDIDPSLGGEVGWELITLNTGCRALVASWSNVPMYSCTTQLYTGMMVLYENTNVIEVYIQEKNNCSGWNGGNAVVGIQDVTGTVATVAPNRNGLDTDWTVTNEAWRFVPNGNPITSIVWYEGSGTSGPIVGNTDQISVCPSSTTIYTAEVTYQLCGGAVLKELGETTVTIQDSKVWNGSIDTNWNNGNNWTPIGVPTAADCVVVPTTTNDPVINGTNYNGQGLNLSVHNNAELTVNPNNSLTITNWININSGGNLRLENSASLLQINNNTNSGNMEMLRNVNAKLYDYIYWSSPVSSYAVTNIAGSYRYKWAPTLVSNYASNYGNWISTNENMLLGKGYIVRTPNNFTTTPQIFTATFNGTPNNGIINTPISRSTYNGANYIGPTTTPVTKDDDNWNLVGNPYPSAINAIDFLTLNTNIAGFIKIWTHGTLPSSSFPTAFYQNYSYNYTLSDYITYNSTGSSSGPGVFGGNIAAGQGFFVLMNHTTSATTENLVFNNSMRSHTYDNSQFFKSDNSNDSSNDYEKNRIWLDLIDQNNNSTRTLVGYISKATNDIDRLFDATTHDKNIFDIYSINSNSKLNIQGRKLPFDENDQVPLGVYLPQNGNYSIAIGTLDGLFTNSSRNIYIEDLLTSTIHDLRVTPYSFSADAGNIDNRFILRFTTNALNNQNFSSNENDIIVFASEGLSIKSLHSEIENITIFDVLGKKLTTLKDVQKNEVFINDILKNNTTLLLQIKLTNGALIYKKVIY